ncbi:MAG: glycosyltransferase family 4 protein [Caldiserica bacterium]|nr:glycosyltransferase family 4 protein [Caldisericota bacterium]
MRILLATVDFPPIEGGISSISFHLAENLHKLFPSVTVLAPGFTGMEKWDRQRKYKVIRFPGYRYGILRFFPFSLYLIALQMVKKYDVILAMNVGYGGLGGRILKAFFPTRYAVVTYAYEFLKYPVASLPDCLVKIALRNAETILTISTFSKDELAGMGLPRDKIFIFPLGVDINIFRPEPASQELVDLFELAGKKVILTIARLVERKGVDKLIKALSLVREQVPEAVLLIVGRGPEEERLHKLVRQYQLKDSVKFVGMVEHHLLPQYYNLCDVFCLPNRSGIRRGDVEGFGLVFLEANACGKPVVGGNSGGARDAVENGKTGFLVNPWREEKIAEALVKLLKDDALRAKMGKEGRKRVEEIYNWANSARVVKRLLQENV